MRRNPEWGAIHVTLDQAGGCNCTRFNLVAILGAIAGPEKLFCEQRAHTHKISEHMADMPAAATACLRATHKQAQTEVEELDATIRHNLEVLVYGK